MKGNHPLLASLYPFLTVRLAHPYLTHLELTGRPAIPWGAAMVTRLPQESPRPLRVKRPSVQTALKPHDSFSPFSVPVGPASLMQQKKAGHCSGTLHGKRHFPQNRSHAPVWSVPLRSVHGELSSVLLPHTHTLPPMHRYTVSGQSPRRVLPEHSSELFAAPNQSS